MAEAPTVKDETSRKSFPPLHSTKGKNVTAANSQKVSNKHKLITYALTPIVLAGGLILIGPPSANAADSTPTSSATATSGVVNTNHVANPIKVPNSTPTVSRYMTLAGGGGDNVGAPPPPSYCTVLVPTVFFVGLVLLFVPGTGWVDHAIYTVVTAAVVEPCV